MLLREDVEFPSGGMGVHVINLVNQLKEDYEITIACLACRQDTHVKEWNGVRLLKIGCENIINNCFKTPMTEEVIEMNILNVVFTKYMKEWEFDIIHLHDCPFFFWVHNLLAPYYGARVVMTTHLSYTLSQPAPDMNHMSAEHYSYMVQKEGLAINCCDALITVSEQYKQDLSMLLVNGKKINVIRNGVNYEELQQVKHDETLRSLFGHRKLAVFVGRMVWTKGIDLILDVIPDLQEWMFVFISNIAPTLEPIVPLVNKIETLMNEHDNVMWLRDVSDEFKWKIMKVADVGLMPSVHEPFGIVALEWMAIGVPLIATNIISPCNDDNCLLIPPDSVELHLALKHFEDLYTSDRYWNGLHDVEQYDWKSVAEETKVVYEEVLTRAEF